MIKSYFPAILDQHPGWFDVATNLHVVFLKYLQSLEMPPIRIYCDGVYDLFHLGHMAQLEQIKLLHPSSFLIVGVCNDKDTLLHKRLPVLTHQERMDTVRHCKWVDMVVEGYL